MSQFAVTGGATADGGPIYLTPGGDWSRDVRDAALLDEAHAQERTRAAIADSQAVVCDPYPIAVSTDGGDVRPLTLKEQIRAKGPTVAYGA